MVLHALNRKVTVRLKLLRDEPHSNALSQEKIEYVVETGWWCMCRELLFYLDGMDRNKV